MSHDHLDRTTKEAVARLHGDGAGDVAAYDAVHNQILQMADGLTMGIVKQFPGSSNEATLSIPHENDRRFECNA